jgi:hypothetical protein
MSLKYILSSAPVSVVLAQHIFACHSGIFDFKHFTQFTDFCLKFMFDK